MDSVNQEGKHDRCPVYEIRVKGHLDNEWSEWFEGLSLTLEADGSTRLSGPLIDQAALYGILKRLNEFGIPLISFKKINQASHEKEVDA